MNLTFSGIPRLAWAGAYPRAFSNRAIPVQDYGDGRYSNDQLSEQFSHEP